MQEIHKQKFTQAEAPRPGEPGSQNFIPGGAPVGESQTEANDEPINGAAETVGQVNESANSSSKT